MHINTQRLTCWMKKDWSLASGAIKRNLGFQNSNFIYRSTHWWVHRQRGWPVTLQCWGCVLKGRPCCWPFLACVSLELWKSLGGKRLLSCMWSSDLYTINKEVSRIGWTFCTPVAWLFVLTIPFLPFSDFYRLFPPLISFPLPLPSLLQSSILL